MIKFPQWVNLSRFGEQQPSKTSLRKSLCAGIFLLNKSYRCRSESQQRERSLFKYIFLLCLNLFLCFSDLFEESFGRWTVWMNEKSSQSWSSSESWAS